MWHGKVDQPTSPNQQQHPTCLGAVSTQIWKTIWGLTIITMSTAWPRNMQNVLLRHWPIYCHIWRTSQAGRLHYRQWRTISFFLKGLMPSILEDIMKPPFVTNYVNIKQHAVDITKAKQLIEGICTHWGIQPTCTFQNTFEQQRQCQPFFSKGGQN